MEKEVCLTTIDNPYDPFDEFASWFCYDVEKGYYSCAYLARVVSSLTNDSEDSEMIEAAIDEIIEIDPFKLYRKVRKNDKKS